MTEEERKRLTDVGMSDMPMPEYQGGSFDEQLRSVYDRILNREPFQYDVNADPLYQTYKDRYMQQGKLAMRDTMGRASGLTGGYGSTYSQAVGQQAYDASLQGLSDKIPELYSLAYSMHKDKGDELKDQAALLSQERDAEYGRWRDAMSDWNTERAYRTDQEQTAYTRQEAAYSKLYALMLNYGYQPSEEELAEAGMSESVAQVLMAEYARQHPQAAAAPAAVYYGGGSGNGSSGSGSGSLSGKIENNISKNGTNTSSKPTRGEVDRAARAAYQNGEITYSEYRTILSGIH